MCENQLLRPATTGAPFQAGQQSSRANRIVNGKTHFFSKKRKVFRPHEGGTAPDIWRWLDKRISVAMPKEKKVRPPQHQRRQPGRQYKMRPQPKSGASDYLGSGKLRDRVALITGGDSGIGRAVAVLYAKEGADVAVVYFNEHKDARETKRLVEEQGRKCVLIAGDIGEENVCRSAVAQTKRELGKVDILVNNAAEQHPQ